MGGRKGRKVGRLKGIKPIGNVIIGCLVDCVGWVVVKEGVAGRFFG